MSTITETHRITKNSRAGYDQILGTHNESERDSENRDRNAQLPPVEKI